IYRIAGMAVKHDGQLLEEGQSIELDEAPLSPWLVEVKTTQASGQKADSKTDQPANSASEDTPPAGDATKADKKGEGK
ncbi:hypothetical protein, partial [Chromobacterium violaceum]